MPAMPLIVPAEPTRDVAAFRAYLDGIAPRLVVARYGARYLEHEPSAHRILRQVQVLVLEITDAWREAEAKRRAQCKYVIGKTVGIRIVLFNAQFRFVVQQAVQHMRRIAYRRGDGLDVIRRVLIGNVCIEVNPGIGAVTQIDLPGPPATTADLVVLTI